MCELVLDVNYHHTADAIIRMCIGCPGAEWGVECALKIKLFV